MSFRRRLFSTIRISKFDGENSVSIKTLYKKLEHNLRIYMKENNKFSLTLSEKILYSHYYLKGKIIHFDGDDIRDVLDNKDYSEKGRKKKTCQGKPICVSLTFR